VLVSATAGIALAGSAAPGPAEAAITCDRTQSVGVSIQYLISTLTPGQTGCLRGGAFFGEDVTLDKDVTLTSYGGEDVTVNGSITVTGSGASIEKLRIVGRSDPGVDVITVRAPNVTLRGNEITAGTGTASCIVAASSGGLSPDNLLVERNRVHDCGTTSAGSDALRLAGGVDAVVSQNVFYDNPNRAILLSNALRPDVVGNTVVGNGTGIRLEAAASGSTVETNTVSHSSPGPNIGRATPMIGTGNVVRNNCGDAGIEGSTTGVTVQNNVTATPNYTDRSAKDFSIASGGCFGYGAPAEVAGLRPQTTMESGPTVTDGSTGAVTFSSDRAGTTFECRLDGPDALQGEYGECVNAKSYSALAPGAYTVRVRARLGAYADPTPATAAFTINGPALGCHQTISQGASVQTLVNALGIGQTGCLRAGTYTEDVTIAKRIRLTSYGGQAATIRGRLTLSGAGAGVEKLKLDGRNAAVAASPLITAPDVVLRNNEITNVNAAAYCIDVHAAGAVQPTDVIIERNRIHHCGSGGTHAAVFAGISLRAHVHNNVIYDNPGWGIEAWSSRRLTAGFNTVDGNGYGTNIDTYAADTRVHDNVAANSTLGANLGRGTNVELGNVIEDNCGNGGVATSNNAVTVRGNVTAVPSYRDRAAKDFTIDIGGACFGKGADANATTLEPDTKFETGPTITGSSVTLAFSSTRPGSTFECRLDGPSNAIGAWEGCTAPQTYSGLVPGGSYTVRVRAKVGARTDPSPATATFTMPCTPALGSLGGTGASALWPPACWRPYAATSPFNQPLPPDSVPLESNSQDIVDYIVDKAANKYPATMVAGADGGGGEPTYYARASDPLWHVNCLKNPQFGTCEIQDVPFHAPAGATATRFSQGVDTHEPLGAENPTDSHMTIVDQVPDANGVIWEYDLWEVSRIENGEISVGFGGREPVATGVGNGSAATASAFANLAGILRLEELTSPEINHALRIVLRCTRDKLDVVYPVLTSERGHGGTICPFVNDQPDPDAPRMGNRLFLTLTEDQIDGMKMRAPWHTADVDVPEWRERIYRAMRRYGMFAGDTGTADIFAIEKETGRQYTQAGVADRWRAFAQANWDAGSGTDLVGFFRYDRVENPVTHVWEPINWKTALAVAAPCVSQGTC
jgi:parallel beta-helix repeat protein